MRTFKELQDDVLQWTSDVNDTGTMRNITKDAIKRAHQNLLTEQMYDFMLWPKQETLAIVAGRREYVLHPLYMQGLWFYNTTANSWMEEVPARGTKETVNNPHDAAAGEVAQFMLTSVVPVQKHVTAGSALTITASGSELAANSVTVMGIDSNGVYKEETAFSLSPWTVISTTTTWNMITGITKNGASWTYTITITDSSGDTILQLTSGERGKQFRQFELVGEPAAAATVIYRFYQKPRVLEEDYDTVQVPEEFDQILVYKALLNLAGYTRATKDEQMLWNMECNKLEFNLKSTYTQSRTLGGRPHYVRYVER